MLFGSIGYAITMNTIKCSVLMCVYGGDDPAAVAASLESLVSQSRPPDEIVLVRRCGKFLPGLYEPGAHLGLPLGIEKTR